MLFVKTYVDKSRINGAGVGLFAGQDIKKGEVVWDFTEGFDLRFGKDKISEIEKILPNMGEFIERYGYMERNGGEGFIVLSFDNARFINHSPNPNLDDKRDKTYALRDIKKGAELLCNYSHFSTHDGDREFNERL